MATHSNGKPTAKSTANAWRPPPRQPGPLSHTLRLWMVTFAILTTVPSGCHRSFYRRQADVDAARLVREKAVDCRWDSADGCVDIDPQSRMFNPFSADHAPIPPDDPTSHQLMRRVDCKEGYPHWHANGDTDWVENPQWRSRLPVDDQGRAVLTLDRAFELALLHSPQYQQQRETLYLSALDVSLQRFGFDTQLFAGFNNFLTTQGRLRNGDGRSATTLSRSLGVNGGGIDFRRLGVTGATFTAGLANTLMWNIAGNNTQSASTLIDFSVIQPLLRGAGRERILESLTQSERTLLANIRQYERFRRGFYLSIATGRSAGAGPSRGGDFLGLAAGANIQAGGYFGLLQQQQQIRNAEFNLRLLEGVLEQFRTFYLEDRIDSLQVRQFESTVFQQQQGLLNAKVAYETSLDQFKQQLGLPPYLEITISDPYLDQFNIISDSISGRLADISLLRIEVGDVIDSLAELNDEFEVGVETERPVDIAPLVATLARMKPLLQKSIDTAEAVRSEDYKEVLADIQRLEKIRPERIAYLRKLRREIASGRLPSEVEPQIFSADSVPVADAVRVNLDGEGNQRSALNRLQRVDDGLEKLMAQIEEFETLTKRFTDRQTVDFIEANFQGKTPDLLTALDGTILELALLQAEARSNVIEIPTVAIESKQAFEIARCFRRDWMNARASLVDDWRQIEFVADQLEAQVDLVFDGDVRNTGDNPFKVRYETGQLRAGLRFDAPIVRQRERNDYREALITYQQSRRRFYQFEDDVSRNLRLILRNIDRNKVLFELNRQSIQVNIDAVELSRFRLEEPPRPGSQGSFGQTTARDLSQAITGLNSVQNQYVTAYVQYEVLRRSLDFDMGTMQLDEAGRWIDPGEIDSGIGLRVAQICGIDSNCEFCDQIAVVPNESTINGYDSVVEGDQEGDHQEAKEDASFEDEKEGSAGSVYKSTEKSAEESNEELEATRRRESRIREKRETEKRNVDNADSDQGVPPRPELESPDDASDALEIRRRLLQPILNQ